VAVNIDPAAVPPVVDPAVWRHVDMRRALASRDLAEVFRRLRQVGLSQRTVAAMTGLSQSEVYEASIQGLATVKDVATVRPVWVARGDWPGRG
jgi:hypothetical protein